MMLSIGFAVFIKSWLTFRLNHTVNRIVFDNMHEKQKASTIIRLSMPLIVSGQLETPLLLFLLHYLFACLLLLASRVSTRYYPQHHRSNYSQ